MNDHGKGSSGLLLVLLLLAVALTVFLFVRQLGSLGFGRDAAAGQDSPVDYARKTADSFNAQQQARLGLMEEAVR